MKRSYNDVPYDETLVTTALHVIFKKLYDLPDKRLFRVVYARFIDKQTLKAIAKKEKLSHDRIHQLECKGLKKVAPLLAYFFDEFTNAGRNSYPYVFNGSQPLKVHVKYVIHTLVSSDPVQAKDIADCIGAGCKIRDDYMEIIEHPEPITETTTLFSDMFRDGVSHVRVSTRLMNSLNAAGIQTVGDLVQKTVNDLTDLKDFGRTSLDAVRYFLLKNNIDCDLTKACKKVGEDVEITLDTSLTQDMLDRRAMGCCKLGNIRTVGDLVGKTPSELYGLRNFGRKTYSIIQQFLKNNNLSLKEEPKKTYAHKEGTAKRTQSIEVESEAGMTKMLDMVPKCEERTHLHIVREGAKGATVTCSCERNTCKFDKAEDKHGSGDLEDFYRQRLSELRKKQDKMIEDLAAVNTEIKETQKSILSIDNRYEEE